MKQLGELLSWVYSQCVKLVKQDTTISETTQTIIPLQNPNRLTKLGYRRLGILVGVLIVLLLIERRDKKPEIPSTHIKLSGEEHVEIKDMSSSNDSQTSTTSETRNSSRAIPYTPPEGTITLVPIDPNIKDINTLIKIKRQTYGFTFEPGLQTSFINEPNFGMDAKLAYVGRFGFNLGILGGSGFILGFSPTASISYRLDRIYYLHNTEMWIGVVPLATITYQVGLRINL